MLNSIWEMLIRRSRVDQSESGSESYSESGSESYSESGSESYSESSSSSSGGGIPTDYVLYMPFTEDLLDHSTYARSFITSGTAPTLKTDEGIPCAEFPLSTNMRTTDNTGITLGTGDRTMSLWFRSLSSTPSNQYNFILALGSGTNRSQTSIGADRDTGTMQYGGGLWGGSASTIVKNTPVDTLWHHMLWMIKNNHTSLYFDGVLARYSDDTLTLASDACITLRNTCNSFSYPFGAVCQYSAVRIYDRAVTDDEIQALANEFGEESSSSGSDSSSSVDSSLVVEAELDTTATPTKGTLVSMYSNYWTFSSIDGVNAAYSSATNYNSVGSNTGFVFTPSTAFTSTDSVTLSCWCDTNIDESLEWIFLYGIGSNGNSNNIALEFWRDADTQRFENPWGKFSGEYNIARGVWHHIVLTYDGTYAKIYDNGTLVYTSSSISISTPTTNVCVGGRFTDGRPWNGYLRKFKAYNVALTSQEISDLYNAELPTFQPANPSTLTVSVTSDYPPGYMAAGTYNLSSGTGTSAVYTQSGGTYELSYNTTDARWEITDTPPDPSFPRAVYFYNATLTGNYTPYIDYYGTCTVN